MNGVIEWSELGKKEENPEKGKSISITKGKRTELNNLVWFKQFSSNLFNYPKKLCIIIFLSINQIKFFKSEQKCINAF